MPRSEKTGKANGRASAPPPVREPAQRGAPEERGARDAGGLDRYDIALLAELQRDARQSNADLAGRIGLSPAPTWRRVRRLEELGVITGYRAEISPAALGLPVTAFVRIRPTAGQLPKIAELAAATPEVSECHRISGEDCFLIKIHTGAIEELEAILDRFLTYGQTTTSIVVSTPVPPRTLPITD